MEVKEVRTHHIPAKDNVTSIDVFLVWYGEQAYQITIRCYDHAWTAYRGSCGHDRIEDYFTDIWFERGYQEHLVNLFLRGSRHTKSEEKWLHQIIRNMCEHFKKEAV